MHRTLTKYATYHVADFHQYSRFAWPKRHIGIMPVIGRLGWRLEGPKPLVGQAGTGINAASPVPQDLMLRSREASIYRWGMDLRRNSSLTDPTSIDLSEDC